MASGSTNTYNLPYPVITDPVNVHGDIQSLAEQIETALDDNFVTLTGTATLTNKTISGSNNTLSNIGNASLTNSSVTINGTSISLGSSSTITAVSPNALTIGTGLSGTSYDGSSAATIAIDSTVATLTGIQTLTNKTLTSPTINNALQVGSVLRGPEERWSVSATAATGTVNLDILTSGILYYTTNASGNWTLNIRGDGSTTLNDSLTTNDSITVVFLVTNGSTAYYQTGFSIDGSSITPKWQGGTAPTSGNINSIDIYSYVIVKTGNAAFTVFGSQTKFA